MARVEDVMADGGRPGCRAAASETPWGGHPAFVLCLARGVRGAPGPEESTEGRTSAYGGVEPWLLGCRNAEPRGASETPWCGGASGSRGDIGGANLCRRRCGAGGCQRFGRGAGSSDHRASGTPVWRGAWPSARWRCLEDVAHGSGGPSGLVAAAEGPEGQCWGEARQRDGAGGFSIGLTMLRPLSFRCGRARGLEPGSIGDAFRCAGIWFANLPIRNIEKKNLDWCFGTVLHLRTSIGLPHSLVVELCLIPIWLTLLISSFSNYINIIYFGTWSFQLFSNQSFPWESTTQTVIKSG